MQIFTKCCYHNLDISATIAASEIDQESIESITIESWHAKLIIRLKHGQNVELKCKEVED